MRLRLKTSVKKHQKRHPENSKEFMGVFLCDAKFFECFFLENTFLKSKKSEKTAIMGRSGDFVKKHNI